eukprot:TRINITY_DN12569_c0_g1_i1.p1 TRINITY_DN12569_c0_g1~~TRINITY_DN12569_c0_g1_i1.p1  ORF type:complete len:382 (+),score=51.95 TRINITY_DN12569_c0_g1_i1:337-1482(+)
MIYKEVFLLKLLDHPHIVKLYHVRECERQIYLVFEHIEGGELFERIEPDVGMDERTARPYFLQLLDGVEHMHARGIAHRDLKPENLLLGSNGKLKIIDFGLATLFKSEDGHKRFLSTDCGTPAYVAPEVLRRYYDGQSADIWSCGVILFAMLTGSLPWEFPLPESPEFCEYIRGNLDVEPWHLISPLAKDLVTRMLHIDPSQRITLDNIRRHPWFLCESDVSLNYDDASMDSICSQPSPVSKCLANADFDLEDQISCFSQPEPEKTLYCDENIRPHQPDVPILLNVSQRMTRFLTSYPSSWVVGRIRQVFQEEGLIFHENANKFSFQAPNHRKGTIQGTVHIFRDRLGGKHIVDFQRRKGDIYEFKRFYHKAHQRLKDLCY